MHFAGSSPHLQPLQPNINTPANSCNTRPRLTFIIPSLEPIKAVACGKRHFTTRSCTTSFNMSSAISACPAVDPNPRLGVRARTRNAQLEIEQCRILRGDITGSNWEQVQGNAAQGLVVRTRDL